MDTVVNYQGREPLLRPHNISIQRGDDSATSVMTIALIEHRSLHGECLARALRAMATDIRVITFSSSEQWHLEFQENNHISLILYCCSGRYVIGGSIDKSISSIKEIARGIPVVLISDIEDPDTIIEVIGSGIRGYIPTSASLDIALEAMRLVRVGGTYLPVSAIVNRQRQVSNQADRVDADSFASPQSKFTNRQQAVLSALRQGKANKLIAYELDLKESTVKVHMRNIMKKLRATNRTEVVCMLNENEATGI